MTRGKKYLTGHRFFVWVLLVLVLVPIGYHLLPLGDHSRRKGSIELDKGLAMPGLHDESFLETR